MGQLVDGVSMASIPPESLDEHRNVPDLFNQAKFEVSMRKYIPYICETIGELWDLLGWMMLKSPKFEDKLGYMPGQNIDTTFHELNESLKHLRKKFGEEKYAALMALSDRMRAHFEADPEDKTDDSLAGRDLITEMEALIRPPRKPK